MVDGIGPAKSRKGLWIGVIGAAAVAGAAALFVTQGGRPAAPVAATAAPPPVAPAVPEAPTASKVSFESDPPGATVVRVDTGKELGTTPFSLNVPFSKEAVEFSFRKTGFEEKTLRIVPEKPEASLLASLVAAKEPEPVKEAPKEASKEPTKEAGRDRSSHGASSGGRRGSTAATKTSATTKKPPGKQPLDEDDVLEPSFK
jgi:hypothetical protein